MSRRKGILIWIALGSVLALGTAYLLGVRLSGGPGGVVRPTEPSNTAQRGTDLPRALAPESAPEPVELSSGTLETTARKGADPQAPARQVLAREGEPSPGIRIAGRVVPPLGALPEPELRVVARGRAGLESFELLAEVDEERRFSLELPSRARRATITLQARYLHLAAITVDLGDPPAELLLEPLLGGRLIVRLVAPPGLDDAALEGLRVTVSSSSSTTPTIRMQMASSRGLASFDALPAGAALDVDAWGPGITTSSLPDRVTVPAGREREVAIELVREVRLRGVVRGADGEPVGGAVVNHSVASEFSSSSSLGGAPLDASGSFDLRGLEAGTITLEASHDQHLPAKLELGELRAGDVREDLEIILGSGGRLAGRVTWADGVPAEDIRIQLSAPPGSASADHVGWGDGSPRLTRSDSQGRFEFGGLEGGPFALSATARPRRDVQERLVAAGHLESARLRGPRLVASLEDVPAGSQGLELVLELALPILGRVQYEDGGPVARGDVLVQRLGTSGPFGAPRVHGVRDADGAFELSVAPGSYELTATAGADFGPPVRVEVPQAGAGALLLAPRGARISGQVVAAGGPVAGAQVSLERRGDASWLNRPRRSRDLGGETRTNADGRFEFEALASGEWTLSAEQPELGRSRPRLLHLDEREVLDAGVLELEASGSIEGRLVLEMGPVLGRRISVGGGSSWIDDPVVDEQGRFVVPDLVPGIYSLHLMGELESGVWHSTLGLSVEVFAARSTMALITDVPSPVRVLGQVRHRGDPVASRQVSAHSAERFGHLLHESSTATTDARGRFELELPQAGLAVFTIGEEDSQIRVDRLLPQEESVSLLFELPLGGVSGRLVARDGSPAPDVPITLEGLATDSLSNKRQAFSDGEGRFSFEHVAEGRYLLNAAATVGHPSPAEPDTEDSPRFGYLRSQPFDLLEGQRREDLRLVLPAAATVQGRVTRRAGSLPDDATVSARGADPSRPVAVARIRDGRYRLQGLGVGTYVVSTSHEVFQTRTVTLAEGQELELDFDLE